MASQTEVLSRAQIRSIANAVVHATGKRLRSLPLTPERGQQALA
ncbi:MAG: hypothetical protein V4724_22230 [Pseudomonadota bacterium]